MPRPILYVRHGCHLCEDAAVVLDEVLGADGWEAVDVETDDDLLARYAHRIPVLVVDGRERAELVISPMDVRTALDGR